MQRLWKVSVLSLQSIVVEALSYRFSPKGIYEQENWQEQVTEARFLQRSCFWREVKDVPQWTPPPWADCTAGWVGSSALTERDNAAQHSEAT